jgi:CheY-like chemotaxis protein
VQRRLREQDLAAAQARSSFLQAASHDLRQPLHALSLYLSLLGDEPRRGRDPAFMAQLQHSAAALQGLFDALLDIGRLETGEIEPRPRAVALRPLLRGLVEESRGSAQRKGLRLIERLEPVAGVSDPLLLERIVRNLLVNALRYTPSGWVALRCIERGGLLWLQVFDSGPGLPPERRAHLSGRDMRDGVARGGAGLGLAIVRELARRLGHPLRVRSRAGRGSVFTLELPRAGGAAPAVEARAAAAPRDRWPDGHVLLVEDDPEVRAATAARLRAWGATVEEAGTLSEARACLADGRRRPSLLLLDVQLPDGRGTELRDALRGGASPPIVWVTADPKRERLDAEIVLHKPVTALKLRSALDAARRRGAPTSP